MVSHRGPRVFLSPGSHLQQHFLRDFVPVLLILCFHLSLLSFAASFLPFARFYYAPPLFAKISRAPCMTEPVLTGYTERNMLSV